MYGPAILNEVSRVSSVSSRVGGYYSSELTVYLNYLVHRGAVILGKRGYRGVI
mgnify:CR=1 FL=1